jgi:hypothetical protein
MNMLSKATTRVMESLQRTPTPTQLYSIVLQSSECHEQTIKDDPSSETGGSTT